MANYSYHDFLALFGVGGAHPGSLAQTKKMIANLKINKSTTILDAGCGTGQTSAYLAKKYGCNVHAIDKHHIMVKKAEERFYKDKLPIHLSQDDIHSLPFQNDTFDYVISESVVVFTTIQKSLLELARVLKNGGMLLILEMTARTPFKRLDLQKYEELYNIKRIPTKVEWEKYLFEAGFTSIKTQEIKLTQTSACLSAATDPDATPEFTPSSSINPKLNKIWAEHEALTEQHKHNLSYTIYFAVKG